MKRYLTILLSALFVCCFALPAFAAPISGVGIPDRDPKTSWHDITLEDAFKPDKLNRTVTVDGKQQKDVLIVVKNGSRIAVDSMADIYNNNPGKNDSLEDLIRKYLDSRARDYATSYPRCEVVSINGVAWQNTEWGDYLKEGIEHFIGYLPSEKFSKDTKQQQVALNPIYNGLGRDIFDKGMSLSEAQKKGEKLQGENVPAPVPEPDPSLPVGENITLTMQLNNPTYTVRTKAGTVTKTLDTAPFATKGVTLVPVRGVFESFNAYVEWLPKTREVRVTKGNDLIILKINSKTATVNGKSAKLLQPAQIVNGRTMIPLRFISENIGYYVQYVSKTKQIIIVD